MRLFNAVVFLAITGSLWALPQQEQKADEKKPPAPMTAASRLAAAKTAFLKKSGGGNIPFDTISSMLEGWGRFSLVDAPEKADVVIEVFSTEDSPVVVSSSVDTSAQTGHTDRATHSSKEITVLQIKLSVYDAKTKLPLWSGMERPKHAMKKVDSENNQVEAAQRLAARFHDSVEPPQK